jgi:hypothetical protein
MYHQFLLLNLFVLFINYSLTSTSKLETTTSRSDTTLLTDTTTIVNEENITINIIKSLSSTQPNHEFANNKTDFNLTNHNNKINDSMDLIKTIKSAKNENSSEKSSSSITTTVTTTSTTHSALTNANETKNTTNQTKSSDSGFYSTFRYYLIKEKISGFEDSFLRLMNSNLFFSIAIPASIGVGLGIFAVLMYYCCKYCMLKGGCRRICCCCCNCSRKRNNRAKYAKSKHLFGDERNYLLVNNNDNESDPEII